MSLSKIQGGGDSPPGGTSERRHHGRKSLLQRVPQGLHCTMGKFKKNWVKSSQIISPPIFNENLPNFEGWCINIQQARKPRSYASPKLCPPTHSLTHLLTDRGKV